MPALLFIPGMNAVRPATRVAAYMLGLLAWVAVAAGPRKGVTSGSFPARPWLLFCIATLVLLLAHPDCYSPIAAFGHVVLYVAVMSPAFWAGDALASPAQLRRLLAVLFLCSAASASMGLAQVFSPERFNPPVIPHLALEGGSGLVFEMADGRKVIRPCGLTDTPGAAAPAGAAAALIGLCFALRPAPLWRRGACVVLAFVGVAVIYYSQVRAAMVVLAVCFTTVASLWAYRGDWRSASTLVGGGATMLGGALVWVARTMGSRVFERFGTLFTTSPMDVYSYNRGAFALHALTILKESPLGVGLGRWGMVHMAFRDPGRLSNVWVEIMLQAWAVDGGVPLAVGYAGAVAVALYDSLRIVLTSRDKELTFWAAVIFAQNLSSAALCFSYPTFLSPTGLQFWMLAAALHAADAQTRAAERPPASRPRPEPRPRWRPAPTV
jgi:hypothetical protein